MGLEKALISSECCSERTHLGKGNLETFRSDFSEFGGLSPALKSAEFPFLGY